MNDAINSTIGILGTIVVGLTLTRLYRRPPRWWVARQARKARERQLREWLRRRSSSRRRRSQQRTRSSGTQLKLGLAL